MQIYDPAMVVDSAVLIERLGHEDRWMLDRSSHVVSSKGSRRGQAGLPCSRLCDQMPDEVF